MLLENEQRAKRRPWASTHKNILWVTQQHINKKRTLVPHICFACRKGVFITLQISGVQWIQLLEHYPQLSANSVRRVSIFHPPTPSARVLLRVHKSRVLLVGVTVRLAERSPYIFICSECERAYSCTTRCHDGWTSLVDAVCMMVVFVYVLIKYLNL